MTICIAAIANKNHVVVASDRMVTLAFPSTEFEQGIPKTIQVTNNCVAATAGSALAYTPIFRESQIEISNQSTNDILSIAETTRLHYVTNRNKKMDQDILSKIGINLQSFYASNRALAQEVVAQTIQAMAAYNYNLSILITGVDTSGGHIYRIDNPGRLETFDVIGHCAIGSGELHAISTFVANDYTPTLDLNHVLELTYEAKRRSEKAQGVGEKSDIYIIFQDKTIKLAEGIIIT
jgi:20S proteasome alpha/beta subunit